ncbi:zinc/manganese transport system ATP-binding protein [Nocardia transvalensis]|uniref:Zinc/manganese transport system ATP-binding protein n=1 Tax=Nocardia transvalensis TaxID=37333 RepID=A0A7W9PJX1_9NOCA|nr:zinc ABC transporter ATP-binding protein AztA [Nocardia transvalensis]MBB5917376.1 zinc/manganese transport system ATP-binding protein [Nocardia transvalensis]
MRTGTIPAVRIESLSAGYRSRTVLHEITADIPDGRVTAIVGPNGSGKSTLLGAIAGVVAPAGGTIERARGGRPAFVVQQSAVPATLPVTVREAVAMGRWAHRGAWRRLTRADAALVRDCMDRLGIGGLARRRLTALSGGQRQRALLAQALAQEADLLLLDEPTAGLDVEAQQQISDILREVAAGGVTVVQATHDHDEAARADHCLVLGDGRLRAAGGPETLVSYRGSARRS